MFMIPYPSMVHWSRTYAGKEAPWAKVRSRPHLMSLIMEQRHKGILRSGMLSWKLRAALWQACTGYGQQLCVAKLASELTIKEIFDTYATSEFCLQPQGDTCERKGILDSILVGCIPVLFREKACPMDTLFHFHWGAWQKESVVFFKVSDVLKRTVDVKASLEAIPKEERDRKRAAIARFGRLLQYNVDDPLPEQDDALSWIFATIAEGKRHPLPYLPMRPGVDRYGSP